MNKILGFTISSSTILTINITFISFSTRIQQFAPFNNLQTFTQWLGKHSSKFEWKKPSKPIYFLKSYKTSAGKRHWKPRKRKIKYLHSKKKRKSENAIKKYFINNGWKSIFRGWQRKSNSTSVHAHTFWLARSMTATTKGTSKGKIEIMNKLLWITTLPNTSLSWNRHTKKSLKEKPIRKLLMLIIWFWFCLQTRWSDFNFFLFFLFFSFRSIDARGCEYASSIQFMFFHLKFIRNYYPRRKRMKPCMMFNIYKKACKQDLAIPSQFFILFNSFCAQPTFGRAILLLLRILLFTYAIFSASFERAMCTT